MKAEKANTKKTDRSCKRFVFADVGFSFLLGCLLIAAAGCESSSTSTALNEQMHKLSEQNSELKRELKQAKLQNQQLKKQLQTLSALKEKDKLDELNSLRSVKIHRYTNLYDKDEDGRKEKLVVYVQPMDEEGDIVKSAGSADVQLWNLNNPEGQALLGQWHVEPEQLKKLWFATILTQTYRLTFDISEKVENFIEPLTVKVTFVDYLTGKVFEAQKVIKP